MSAPAPTDRNRRVFYRLPIQLPVRYRLAGDEPGPWVDGQTVNLSAGGLLLRGPMLGDADQDALLMGYRALELELGLPSGKKIGLRGCAAWMESEEDGGSHLSIGIEFELPACPARDEIQAFVQHCCGGGRSAMQ